MKILMVCLGNICRSPLAEGIMQRLADEAGLDWQIDSAGTGNWHAGKGPHHGSVRVARSHGIDISKQVCRVFRMSDFDEFDLILVMDKNNLSDVLAQARHNADTQKVRLLLGDKEVPDPYYTNLFDEAYELIEQGCKKVIEEYSK
jgi:protein-tyrosine phosphatase